MAERDSETVGSPSSNPPAFIRLHRRDYGVVSPIITCPRAREPRRALRASWGSEFLTHAVTAGEMDNLGATKGDTR